VVIPKEFREALGLRSGVEVIVELRGDEVVIRKAKPSYVESFTDFYVATRARKLSSPVDIERLLEGEVEERHGLLRR